MFRFIQLSVFLFELILGPQAQAIIKGAPLQAVANCMRVNPIEDYRNLIHKTAVVEGENEVGRLTEEEFASDKAKSIKEIQERFGATGRLKCPGGELSAQLTGAHDVITTAGHGFWNPKNCEKESDPLQCTFTIKIGDYEKVSKVTRLVDAGMDCPNTIPRSVDDWAVLKIEPSLEEVVPYSLPNEDEFEIQENESVISVSSGARDFTRIEPKTGKRIMPKTIEECKIKKVWSFLLPAIVASTCDFARGNSGGTILRSIKGRDVMTAISVTNHETASMLNKAEKNGLPNKGPYRPDKWTTYHIPLNSRFLAAVKRAGED